MSDDSITERERSRRTTVRRRSDLYLGVTEMYMCPYSHKDIIYLLNAAVVPLSAVLWSLQDNKTPSLEEIVNFKKAHNMIESMRDSLKPCFCPPRSCPRSSSHPWRNFLIWIVSKIS